MRVPLRRYLTSIPSRWRFSCARRTVSRLTPSCSASSAAAGSRLPENSPRAIASRSTCSVRLRSVCGRASRPRDAGREGLRMNYNYTIPRQFPSKEALHPSSGIVGETREGGATMNLGRGNWLILAALLGVAAGADEPPLRAIIDREIDAHLGRLQITPGPLADDATFLRRATLDLIGTIPAADEVEKFLADKDPEKRSKAVDRLLADPRYATHQSTQWDLALFTRHPANSEVRKRESFQKWLIQRFEKNVSYDKWVLDLFLAEGNAAEQGAPLYLTQFRGQALETAEGVTRMFLGTQIRCARCHDHPSDKWTQKDFYGFAAFF